jgi:hypothetical protein
MIAGVGFPEIRHAELVSASMSPLRPELEGPMDAETSSA